MNDITMISCCLLLVFCVIYVVNMILNSIPARRKLIFEKYVEILTIIERAKSIAFEKIWREELIVYVADEHKLTNQALEEPTKMYLRMLFDICGPSIIEDLVLLHGNIESISLQLANEFISMVSDHEVTVRSHITGGQTLEQDIGYKDIISGKM